MPGLLYIDHKM